MIKIVVWSEVVGYMQAELKNGSIEDELGHRKDLETPENTTLIQMQLDAEDD